VLGGACTTVISVVNQKYATTSQIYFIFGITLHVSDGLSVHHQEFKTVHTATGICQTDAATCLLASSYQMPYIEHKPTKIIQYANNGCEREVIYVRFSTIQKDSMLPYTTYKQTAVTV
jgi:hypothetical protein